MSARTYLDWNATAPLRPEARKAMIAAMDVAGNPSSVHAEGRAAKALVERSRATIAEALGCKPVEVIFTSGATEAAALAFGSFREPVDSDDGTGPAALQSLCSEKLTAAGVVCSGIEHDAVFAHATRGALLGGIEGGILNCEQADIVRDNPDLPFALGIQLANSETGIIQPIENWSLRVGSLPRRAVLVTDATQGIGKIPFAFGWSGFDMALCSAHKLGGPKGVGALIVRDGLDIAAMTPGGGQEMGRRSGTENVIGIAGFAAALEAATRDLEAGVWDRVAELRSILEKTLASAAKETIFVGNDVGRIPNTSCFATPGWKGETQVMAMDLAGFAISSGSACSSGKVRESRVLKTMGYDARTASSAVRVSLGPTTREEDVTRFADAWLGQHEKFRLRAA